MMDEAALIERIEHVRVVPVIDPKSFESCLSVVEALVGGGAEVIEITLRSEIARNAFDACRASHPDIILGAGSVVSADLYENAVKAGADFTIAPGRCPAVERAARGNSVVHVPGIMTPSEIIAARSEGFTLVKYYPSEACGGSRSLKDLGRIFPDVRMMPSGGINLSVLPGYSAVPTVLSAGGSWMFAEGGEYLAPGQIEERMQMSVGIMTS